jgi:23S rRNA pseudouridine1911/1915/1917 synthase
MNQQWTLIVPENAGRLDVWVSGQLNVSRSSVQKWCKDGRVLVDGKKPKTSTKLLQGQCIEINVPPPPPTTIIPQKMNLDIQYMDEDIIVVNKPAGLVVHPGKGNWDSTLVNGLVHLIASDSGELMRPGIVHRIDKGTSGLLVVARTERAHRCLSSQFAAHSVERAYLSLVWGEMQDGIIDEPLGRHPVDRIKFTVREDGKRAVTHYKGLGAGIPAKSGSGGLISLVCCRLETGRTHQIRVHMDYIGHPMVGDPLYCRRQCTNAWKPELDRIDRQMLHAWTLGFEHPNGKNLRFSISPPSDFYKIAQFATIDIDSLLVGA